MQYTLPDITKKRKKSFHNHSLTAAPGDIGPVLHTYAEIRKQLHLSLQARLNRDYLYKSYAVRPEASIRENRKLWEAIRNTTISASLSHIQIQAKLKTLATRTKTESLIRVQALSSSFDYFDPGKTIKSAAFAPLYPPVSIKEAMKDREWLARTKETLQKMISALVNESNGLRVADGENGEASYKYYLRKGNNSSLLHQLMQTRPWWVRTKSKSEAHFVWSTKKESSYFALIPTGTAKAMRLDVGKAVIVCPAKFCPPDSKVSRTVNMKPLGFAAIGESRSYAKVSPLSVFDPRTARVHNLIEDSFQLTNKKFLYHNMKQYYSALGEDYTQYLPLTFHITAGESDPEFIAFLRHFETRESEVDEEVGSRNLWILKPGENTNRGKEVAVCATIEQIRARMRTVEMQSHSVVIQQYIDRPFLYNKRKFDIRCYALVTSINGIVQAYYYPEGYLRTSSKEFSLKHISDKLIHLTNDAVQKWSVDYGKFEYGNKLSYSDFQQYLESLNSSVSFSDQILPQIRRLVQDSIKATFFKLDPQKRSLTFEILGYDVMLDCNLRPVLIEVNTNPCFALVAPLLFRVIPAMIDGALRLVIDCLFPDFSSKRQFEAISENRWELIFHELVDGKTVLKTLQDKGAMGITAQTEAWGEEERGAG